MNDIIVKGHLKAFTENFGFDDLQESEMFERFCSYALLSKHFDYTLTSDDLENLSVGLNKGIDTIGIFVNNQLICSKEEYITEFAESKAHQFVKIFFIQSKTSESFKDAEIGNFGDTVNDFLTGVPKYDLTPQAQNAHEVYLELLNNLRLIPELQCFCYFCSLGKWNDDSSCSITLEKKKATIVSNGGLFNRVEFNPIDKDMIIRHYKVASKGVNAEFIFKNKVSFDKIVNVDESYIGYLDFGVLRKIIIDPDNGRLRNLYTDNLRDFLGLDNEVNSNIKGTLEEGQFSEFSLLNNGITIIAEKNKGKGDTFILENFQIVNGCQTSNVLYECRNIDNIDQAIVPVKLVITSDENLRDRIILSTNSQSKIEKEGLLALSSFQKKLEDYYVSAKDGLNYERRSNQYIGTNVKQKNIIGIREQMKSFAAMYLDEPDEASGYFGRVYKNCSSKLFQDDHIPEPYYSAGLLHYWFKEMINTKEINRDYNKARYHIYMLFRMLVEETPFNQSMLKNGKHRRYFDLIVSAIRDKNKCLEKINTAIQIVDSAVSDINNYKLMYTKQTTKDLISECTKLKSVQ